MPPISPDTNNRFRTITWPCVATLLACCCLGEIGACSRRASQRAPQVVEERDAPVKGLASGIQVQVNFAEPGYRLIEVSQDKADVQLKVTADGVVKVWDAPARRATPERACLFTPAGAIAIELTSKEPVGASAAVVRLRVSSVAGPASAFPSDAVHAECLETQGALEHALWDEPTALNQAQDYERAAQLWKSSGDEHRMAAAYLQAAWMLTRRTSNMVDALAQGERARAAYWRSNDALGGARATLQMAVPRWELANAGRNESGAHEDAREAILARNERELTVAIAAFEAARDEFDLADAQSCLASNYFQQGRLSESMQTFALAAARFRAAGEIEGTTRALVNLNIVLNRTGNYRDSAAAFDQLLRDRNGGASDEVLADILNNSAATHSAAGNYGRALPQFVEALQIHERTSDFGGMARSLNGLASTYMRLGLPAAALTYAQQARAVLARRGSYQGPGSDNDDLAGELISGNAQRALGDFSAARKSHEAALRFAHSDSTRAQAQLELLRDALDASDADSAKRQIQAATPFPAGATRIQSLQWQFELARTALLEGEPGDAFTQLRQLEGEFAAAGAREFEIAVLHAQAQAQFQRKRLQDALAFNARSLGLLHELRLAVGDPELRARLTSLYRAAYQLRVEVFESLYEATSDATLKSRYLAEMFAAADEARAGLVHESADARVLTGDSAQAKELRDIAAEIALREHVLSALETGSAPGANEATLRAELAVLRTRYDALTPTTNATEFAFDPHDYSLKEVREDTAILLCLASSRTLRRFWVTGGGVQELPAQELASVASSSSADSAARLLPEAQLLAPRVHLIFVVDPALAALPFASLGAGRDGAPLIADHDVTMALTLRDAIRLASQSDRERMPSLARVAVFFDPIFTPYDVRVRRRPPDSSAFPTIARLAGTGTEARDIASRLQGSEVLKFAGFSATREAALSLTVSQASVLHFATHAIASDQWPLGSGLLMTGFDERGQPLNGFLSTLDLLSRRSATELVVLSACDTARGDASAAENVAGLARAFLGGGARRVIATRWAVDDAVTARLMAGFYAGLAAGKPPAAALAAAQLSIYSAAGARKDDTWASFVLYERAP